MRLQSFEWNDGSTGRAGSGIETMLPTTAHDFLGEIRNLLSAEHQTRFDDEFARGKLKPDGLADALVRRGWLTPFQAEAVRQGRASELVLEQYVLLEPIGSGGMGQVYKARHQVMDRIVAVKLIRHERVASPIAMKRFLREIRAVAKLSHPNIVIAHDARDTGHQLLLAMEYCEGATLSALVRHRGALPAAEACEYTRQAALGLQAAHDAGVVHRDVKPDNLLLTGRTVKLLDLGLALLWSGDDQPSPSSLTSDGMVLGTPDFMAPEQVGDAGKVGPRADLYGLGCTLYFLLSGSVPFPGGSAFDKATRHRNDEPTSLTGMRPAIDPALAALVAKMMRKDPARRIGSAKEAAQALDAFTAPTAATLASGPLSPASETPTETPWQTVDAGTKSTVSICRRKARPLLWIAIIGCILGLAGGITWVVRNRAKDTPSASTPTSKEEPKTPIQQTPAKSWRAGAVLRPPVGEWNEVFAIALHPDESLLAIAGGSFYFPKQPGVVGLFKLPDPTFIPLGTHNAMARLIAFSGEGNTAVSFSGFELDPDKKLGEHPNLGEVAVWNLKERKQIKSESIKFDSFDGLSVDGAGKTFAISGRWGFLQVRRMNDLSMVRDLSGQVNEDRITAVALSNDGSLVAGAEPSGRVRIWRVSDGNVIHDWREDLPTFFHRLVFTSDSQRLIGTTATHGRGNAVIIGYDLALDKRAFVLEHGFSHIFGMALTADGRTLATGTQEGPIRIWDLVEREKPPIELKGHQSLVRCLCFSRDGKTLISGSSDGTVRLWHAQE